VRSWPFRAYWFGGERAVCGHRQVTVLSSSPSGVVYFSSTSGHVSFGVDLWAVPPYFESFSIHKNHLIFCLLGKEIAVGPNKDLRFSFFDGSGTISDAKIFRGGKSQSAKGRRPGRESGFTDFLTASRCLRERNAFEGLYSGF